MQRAKNSSKHFGIAISAALTQPLSLIIFIGLLQLFVTLLSDGFVLSFDESIWHYIGRNWLRHGMTPYAGGVDNKSPFIFLIFGLSDWLFGVNYWFPRVLGTICEMIGLYFVYKIADILGGKKAGILVIPIYGLSLLWHATGGKYVDFTETFEVMFLLIAVYKSLPANSRRDWFICGLWAGLAVDFRLTAAFGVLAILLSGFLQKRTVRYQLWLLMGALAGVAILLLICFIAGIKPGDLWTYGFSDNFGAGSVTAHTIEYMLETFTARFIYSPLGLFYTLLFVYVVIQKKIDLLILWCLLSFIAIGLIGIFDVVHLKDILPSLSLINAIALTRLLQRCNIPLFWAFLLLCVLFFPSVTEQINNVRILAGKTPPQNVYGVKPYTNPSEGDRKLLAAWVKQHTRATDLVLVHSYGTQIQCYSERLSPSVYFCINRTPLAKKRFYRDMGQNRPELILVPMFDEYRKFVDPDQRDFVSKLVQQQYSLDTTLYNYKVYRLNTSTER